MSTPPEAKGGLTEGIVAFHAGDTLAITVGGNNGYNVLNGVERREQMVRPALLEAGPQTCGKMELLLGRESWLLMEVEDGVNLGLVTSAVAGLAMIDMVQGILSVHQTTRAAT
jgi:hypothetical protein